MSCFINAKTTTEFAYIYIYIYIYIHIYIKMSIILYQSVNIISITISQPRSRFKTVGLSGAEAEVMAINIRSAIHIRLNEAKISGWAWPGIPERRRRTGFF